LEATVKDLKGTINPSTSFYGTNLFAYNFESFSTTQTVDIYLVNATKNILDSDADVQVTGDTVADVIRLVQGGATKGLVETTNLETQLNTSVNNADSDQHIGLLVIFSSTTALSENTTHDSLYADFMSFGFTNDGDDAADRSANQIVRLELEEFLSKLRLIKQEKADIEML
jgi:hypothetical protein